MGRGTFAGHDASERQWFSVGQDEIMQWLPRGGRDIGRSSSTNLADWSKPALVLPVASFEPKAQTNWVEYMDLQAYRVGGPRTGAWLGQLVVFNSDRSSRLYEMPTISNVWRKGTTDLRLVISRDGGKSWLHVASEQIWLQHDSVEDGYDRLVFPGTPVPVGDQLFFYYSGWDGDHLVFNRDGTSYYPDRLRVGRIALATMRKDGYVSMQAGEQEEGEVVTKPFKFSGTRMTVNLAASDGELWVELLRPDGSVIPGFSRHDCLPIQGDGVALAVKWRDGKNMARLANRPVQVRFLLRRGDLFQFQCHR
jgi:hypothetical protein